MSKKIMDKDYVNGFHDCLLDVLLEVINPLGEKDHTEILRMINLLDKDKITYDEFFKIVDGGIYPIMRKHGTKK